MQSDDDLGFVTTVGRELATALESVDGLSDVSGADCYSAIVGVFAEPLSPRSFGAASEDDLVRIRDALNRFFEVDSICVADVRKAAAAIHWHWREDGEP